MKPFNASDSFSGLISIPSSQEEKSQKTSNHGYSREFQAMLDSLEEEEEEEYSEEAGLRKTEKKRRLGSNQVKALEKNFEVENKLDPERKLKLAQELGLKPRQVAIWFQNRRARWKTKQLERDYISLKTNYEVLQADYNNLEGENKALSQQVKELKAKIGEESSEDGSLSSKEEEGPVVSESENNVSMQRQNTNENRSGISMNEQSNLVTTSNAFMNWIQFQDQSRTYWSSGYGVYNQHPHPHVVKVEDQALFTAEDSCNFFSVDQAPSLRWYFPEQ